jgi:hypothetical protein
MSRIKRLVLIFTTLAILVAVYDLSTIFEGKSSAQEVKPFDGTITGEYHQVRSGIPNTEMSATVSDGAINIQLRLGPASDDDPVTGIFWDGTFDTTQTGDSFNVVSRPDKNVLDMSMLASSETTKKFAYNRGDLSFQFSIMGASTIVHMSK